MKFEITFLRTKVAIRIFVLFICCALLPIITLAVFSFSHVTKQLSKQTQKRLHQANKDVSRAIAERLYFLEGEMKMVAYKLSLESHPIVRASSVEISEHLKKRFKFLFIITKQDNLKHIFGDIQNKPEFIPEQKVHIQSGGSLLFSEYSPDHPSRIFMGMAIDTQNPTLGILVGEINATYLWDIEEQTIFPDMTELCVLDQSNNILFSSLSGPVSIPKQVALKMAQTTTGQFEWVNQTQEYLASYRSIFLQPSFFTRKWTVILSESKSDVLAPMANFKKIFPPIILMALLVVLLLSVYQIRRILIPLENLREGTKRIAKQEFHRQVRIRSGDEFEELATSFNMMSSRLGKQFNALTTMGEIDREILSTLDTGKIVNTLLIRLPEVFPCHCVSVTLINVDNPNVGIIYFRDSTPESEIQMEMIQLISEEIEKLHDHPESLFITNLDVPNYLSPLVKLGNKSFLVLPVFVKEKMSAIINLGYSSSSEIGQEDVTQARQLANQMAVALSNAHLIKELDQLNWGTLTALARTIDAKSPWTAGHSERVTKLALKIGRVLGLSQDEIDTLRRGGLLHDLGKLGIPSEILDKPGKLTDEEKEIMQEHPQLGARILEPISAYVGVIPMVLHHHERFEGTGYPDGLAGGVINLGARIFSVADTFDAITSNRPYRKALGRECAIDIIKNESGKQFDPEIVQAFLEVMAQEVGEEDTINEGRKNFNSVFNLSHDNIGV